ncbi:MAG TPA: GIY-YIG nuclease family protein [Bacteroidales bacterium]|nr:GIY-YIG nuclease family protein [Bacteroidales bacterium]
MFYVYILYSEGADRYYIGHTSEPSRRLEEHNTVIKNSYTNKYRPWIMKGCFQVSESRSEARLVENYLKKMKSRIFIEELINVPEKFRLVLGKVRAIPMDRD